MALKRKFLWIANMDTDAAETAFAKHALAMNATGVCIRTSSTRLPGAIARFKALQMVVYAWKWPGVVPSQHAKHYYAIDEARYVASTLIPKGLDGYVVDPESDGHVNKKTGKKLANDWDQAALAPIAQQFCSIIRGATSGKPFVLGTTSGCNYPGAQGKPNIPWAQFFAASDVLLPQTYWRWTNPKTGKRGEKINGGAPNPAIAKGVAAWEGKSQGRPMLPMAGEMDVVTADEITSYGAELAKMNITEAHFYADNGHIPVANIAAMKLL
jgi:hypothetical protein